MSEVYLFDDEELSQASMCRCPACWANWMAEWPMDYNTKATLYLLEELKDIEDDREKDEFVAEMMFIDEYLGTFDEHSKDEYLAVGRIIRKYLESIGDLWSMLEWLASHSLTTDIEWCMRDFDDNSLKRAFKRLSLSLRYSCPRYLRERKMKRCLR